MRTFSSVSGVDDIRREREVSDLMAVYPTSRRVSEGHKVRMRCSPSSPMLVERSLSEVS